MDTLYFGCSGHPGEHPVFRWARHKGGRGPSPGAGAGTTSRTLHPTKTKRTNSHMQKEHKKPKKVLIYYKFWDNLWKSYKRQKGQKCEWLAKGPGPIKNGEAMREFAFIQTFWLAWKGPFTEFTVFTQILQKFGVAVLKHICISSHKLYLSKFFSV